MAPDGKGGRSAAEAARHEKQLQLQDEAQLQRLRMQCFNCPTGRFSAPAKDACDSSASYEAAAMEKAAAASSAAAAATPAGATGVGHGGGGTLAFQARHYHVQRGRNDNDAEAQVYEQGGGGGEQAGEEGRIHAAVMATSSIAGGLVVFGVIGKKM